MKSQLYPLTIVMLCCCTFITETKAQKTDSIYQMKPLHATRKQLYAPSMLIFFGLGANGNGKEDIKNEFVEERNEVIPSFKTCIDNYLQFSPIALTYGFEVLGIKPKTDVLNRSVILLTSELMMMASVTLLKNVSHTLRPDSSNYVSFPSGHTAQAFAAATLLSEEYGRRYQWVPYLSYGLASSVGLLRMANNKHYLSDVLVGAGIGILSTKMAYWAHQYKWGHKNTSSHSTLL